MTAAEMAHVSLRLLLSHAALSAILTQYHHCMQVIQQQVLNAARIDPEHVIASVAAGLKQAAAKRSTTSADTAVALPKKRRCLMLDFGDVSDSDDDSSGPSTPGG
jgi:hypothetical protein